MLHKIIIYSSVLFTFINCSSQKQRGTDGEKLDTVKTKDTTPVKNTREQLIYFKEGENKFLQDYQMNVTFKGITEDSRCPKGVNCMWAGAAVAQIQVMGTHTRPMTLNISTVDNESRNYSSSTEFNGYLISLEDVTPYPESSGGTKALAGKYTIGIRIQKSGESTPTTK